MCTSIFRAVFLCQPNFRAPVRWLLPSTKSARRIAHIFHWIFSAVSLTRSAPGAA